MASLDDPQGYHEQLQRELEKLDQFPESDQPYIKQAVQKLDGRVKESTLGEYLKNLRVSAKRLDQPLHTLTEQDLDAFVYDLRHSEAYGRGEDPGMSDSTVRNTQFIIRRFLKTVDVDGVDHEWAEDYDLLPPADNTVSPDDMLTSEDIGALTGAANNLRDIAMIEFLADTGVRLSLMMSLRVGDVDLEGKRATFRPNANAVGLKGADIMDYPLIDSKAVLRTYLNQIHPRPDRDDVAFFHKLPGYGNDFSETDGALSSTTVRQQIRSAAEKAGIEKPVNPHNFRHSAITRMRREGYSRSEIEHRVMWEVDTDMWKTYEHIAGEEHNDAIFEQAGVVEDSGATLSRERHPCGNCQEPLAPHHEFCPRCGEPATQRARRVQDAAEDDGLDMLARRDLTDEQRRIVRTALDLVRHDDLVTPDHDRSSSD